VLVTVLGTYTVTRLVAASIQDRLTTQLIETSRAASDSIVAWERHQLDVLRLVVFTSGVPEAFEEDDDTTLRDVLVALAANQDVYLLLALNLDGEVIASAQQSSPTYNTDALMGEELAADYPFIESVASGDTDEFGDKYANLIEVDGQPVLLTVAPVHNAAGEQVGVVAMGTPLEQVLDQTKVDTLANLTLYSPQGGAVETTFVVAEEAGLDSLSITPAQYLDVIGRSEGETPIRTIMLNQREFQTAYVPLVIRRDEIGVLGVSWPSTLITSVITTNRNGLAVMFSLVALLVVATGYMVAYNLTRPIRRLADVAQLVAAGDLSQRSQVRTSDEIGVLGRVFDEMTFNLDQKTEALIRSYEEQERKSAFLAAVIASAIDGTVVVDPKGEMIHQNPAAEQIISLDDLFWRGTLHEVVNETRDVGHWQKRVEVGGQWFELRAAPVKSAQAAEIGVVMTLRDITNEILDERMRTAFILQMSHELYTPLASARGYAELANRTIGRKMPMAQTMLDHSLDSMRELRSLIGQILDVSRMIRGGFEITRTPMELAEVLQSVIDEFRELVSSKALRLQVGIAKPLAPFSGGAEPLRWMFRHLIRNAIYYTPQGGTIKITAEDENNCFMLKVRDTGAGIARHEKSRIFEQFYRGQPVLRDGTAIDVRGAGLGLFVVDQVVKAHGGEIRVWTEQGIGSEFTILLPR
jgi:signal transduction histidine kinase